MKNRSLVSLIAVVLPLLTVVFLLPAAVGAARPGARGDETAVTEDILHMINGRELHGQILEERPDAIVFKLVIRGSGIETTVTYNKREIAEIERDVPLKDAPATATGRRSAVRSGATSRPREDDEHVATFGARRFGAEAEGLPSFYVIPMKGQMGTDVTTEVYEKMIDDIRRHDPEILVIKMECRDNEDALFSFIGREEEGLTDFDEFRKLVNLFQDDLSDYRQVIWIQDSVGVSSVVALVWDELYMTPDARLGGLEVLPERMNFEKWSDDDVRGKMTAAFMSWVKGFLEHGGYSLVLADAMVRPQYSLSGTWTGRTVTWSLDTTGEYIVDNDDETTAQFDAKTAEDLCISDGTAETLDDLALLLGIREYRVLDGDAERIHTKHTESWRRALENCGIWQQDYQQFLGWATGEDELKYLGRAMGRMQKILNAMERYSAVENRVRQELGIQKFGLIVEIEKLKERIRAVRQSQRGRRGGGGGGVGGG